jgi:phage gp46-like protein
VKRLFDEIQNRIHAAEYGKLLRIPQHWIKLIRQKKKSEKRKNRENAMKLLRAKLWELEEEKRMQSSNNSISDYKEESTQKVNNKKKVEQVRKQGILKGLFCRITNRNKNKDQKKMQKKI